MMRPSGWIYEEKTRHFCFVIFFFYFHAAVEITGDSDCFLQEIVPFSSLLLLTWLPRFISDASVRMEIMKKNRHFFYFHPAVGDSECFLQEIVPFSPFLSVGPIQEMPILSRLSRIGPRIKWCLKQCPTLFLKSRQL